MSSLIDSIDAPSASTDTTATTAEPATRVTRYHYASCYGGLWRFTAAGWKRFLEHAVAHDGNADMDDFGERIGHVTDVLDWERREAVEELHDFQRARLKAPKTITITVSKYESECAHSCEHHDACDGDALLVSDDGGDFDGDELCEGELMDGDADDAVEARREHYYKLGHDVKVVRQ